MREPEKLKVDYVGYEKPETPDEFVLEILGLELAIKDAERKIALLKQGLKLAEMKSKK